MTALARFVTFTLHPHPNADRLSIAKIDGTDWQCVTETTQWGETRSGIYVAIDALLDPARPEFEFLKDKATKAFADGRPGHRLKTVRLRGQLSQGLLVPVPATRDRATAHLADWTAILGIERYEPPIPVGLAGDMVREPGVFARYTKIENAKNFPNLFTPVDTVRVTEKIHGTNFRVGLIDPGTLGEPVYAVGTHATARHPDGTNLYSVTAKKVFPEAKLRACLDELNYDQPLINFIVFAEIFGAKVQDLQYGCKPGEQKVAIFDVLLNDQYLDWEEVQWVADFLEVDTVPLLYYGAYDREKVLTLRDGPTTFENAKHVREGVVVTSDPEVHVSLGAIEGSMFSGRKILKYISDAYLERKDAKDGH